MPSLGEIGPVVLEKKIFNFINIFSVFYYYLPLEKGVALHLTFTQGCFVPSLVEIGPVVMEEKTFKYCQYIFTISLLSPLVKGHSPSLKQT